MRRPPDRPSPALYQLLQLIQWLVRVLKWIVKSLAIITAVNVVLFALRALFAWAEWGLPGL